MTRQCPSIVFLQFPVFLFFPISYYAMFLWLSGGGLHEGASGWRQQRRRQRCPRVGRSERVGDAVVPPGASASAAVDLGVLGEEQAEEYKMASR